MIIARGGHGRKRKQGEAERRGDVEVREGVEKVDRCRAWSEEKGEKKNIVIINAYDVRKQP